MNIKELREAIEGLPDHYTVTILAFKRFHKGHLEEIKILTKTAWHLNTYSYGNALVIEPQSSLYIA